MDQILSDIEIRNIFLFIKRKATSNKDIYLDQLHKIIQGRFKLSKSVTGSVINHFIVEKTLIIKDKIISIDFLANDTRKQIFLLIKKYPGIYYNLIKNLLKLGANQVIWHLSALEMNKSIKFIKFGKIRAYSLPNISGAQITIGFLSFRSASQKIFQYLCQHPESTKQSVLINFMNIARTSAYHWFNKLLALDLLEKSKNKSIEYNLSKKYKKKICQMINLFSKITLELN